MKRSFFALSCWLLAPAAFAILDTNYNGFSDLWERGFNNGSLFDQSFDPHSDDDSDGWTNAQEAAAGTSPFDPNPPDGIIRPDIVHTPDVMGEENGVPYIETPEAVTVTWPTIPGKRYHLLVSPDLSQGSWIEVPDSDFIGNGNIPEFHFTTAESDKLFWRVAVEDIDMDSDGLTNHEEFLVGTNPTLTDTDGDTLSDHAELVAGTDALQADGDGDGWTDAQELAAGTDSSYQDTDGDGIPDSIDTQPLVSALAFADADGDGIPDGNDSNSNDPRGPAPSIASGTASGNPLSNLIEDEIVKFALTVSNPAGAAPTASNLTFFLNGIAETDTATITAIGSPVGSSQRFLLTWKAKTTASYPTLSLQNLTLRFRDSQQATSWFMLARIDVAEWEGMVAGLRAGPPSGGWEASIQSHSGGLKSPASYLAGMNGGHALWYRGARNMEIHNSPGPAIFAMIGEGVLYPMIFMSQVGSGPLALHSVADISSAETIPYLGVWAFNDWSESIRINGTGFGCTVPPGGNVYEAIPERTENGNSYVHVEIHRLTADGERMMTDTNWPIYIAQAPARRMTTINFEAGGQGRAKFTAVDCWMPVGAQIAPYTAGTPELPGLPLPGDSHTDSTDSVLLPIAQGAWHKIILKVGPDAAALSNGIGLWLRKGEYGEDAPQTGFTLKVQGENSTLEDLTVPADGKITFAANSQNWQRLTSPEGLTLFMSRDENVDEIHDLSLQLLKKHEWYAQEAVRIASIDLVPVDLDIVHPATGELAEDREDGTSASPDGGYVSVKRTIGSDVIGGEDVTPITKLKIHTIAGAQSTWKTRIKFSGADRYEIYKDEERTEEVLSEQTEFDATQTTTLYFQGLKKSLSRGGENITMQVKVGNNWVDGDSVKCTVVQSEFLIQIKAFIPYEWTEGEYIPQPLPDPVRGKVAKGDYSATSRPTFKNAFSSKVLFYSVAPFRLCHEVILTPYVDLHYFYQDIEEKRQFTSAPSSDHYIKATSVDPTELALKNGYLPLTPPIDATGPPVLSPATYSPELSLYNSLRANKCALDLTGSGRDGALGIYTDVSPAIDWDVRLEIDSSSNPLQPSFCVKGKHDLYPAYEIITLQADGTFKDTHRHMPARNELPGPASLSTAPSITFDNTGTISN